MPHLRQYYHIEHMYVNLITSKRHYWGHKGWQKVEHRRPHPRENCSPLFCFFSFLNYRCTPWYWPEKQRATSVDNMHDGLTRVFCVFFVIDILDAFFPPARSPSLKVSWLQRKKRRHHHRITALLIPVPTRNFKSIDRTMGICYDHPFEPSCICGNST